MITTERSSTGFVHEIEIDAPLSAVHDFLADMDAHAELHPLIESITALPPTASRTTADHYRIVDRIALGPIRFRATYTAALEALSDTVIRGDAWQQPRIRLSTMYRLSPTDTGTRLVEKVSVTAPWPLRRFTVSQACAAHSETIQKMKARLEAS